MTPSRPERSDGPRLDVWLVNRRELVLLSHDAVVTCIQNFAADTNKKTRAELGFLIGGGGGS